MTIDAYARWWRRETTRRGKLRLWDAAGNPITDEAKLARVRKLRLPPAWTDVRVCPSPRAKLQAIGYDAKGRRQYVYHADWVARQAAAKYDKLVAFVQALPRFREVTSAALSGQGLSRERVLSLMTRLVHAGCFRIGGERYARDNKSYGIATLCNRHVKIGESCLQFDYRGKRGVMQRRIVADRELVAVMREVAALPGKRLFQYRRDDGAVVAVAGRELNAFVKELMGPAFSAKDFRTWNGTLMAARILAAYGPARTATERKRNVVRTVKAVARYLGNTPAIARASYISPKVFEAYEQGLTLHDFAPRGRKQARLIERGHSTEELELMKLLEQPLLTSLPRGVTVAG